MYLFDNNKIRRRTRSNAYSNDKEIIALNQEIKELKLVIQELIDAFADFSISIPVEPPTNPPIEPPVEPPPEEPTEPEEPVDPEPPVEPPIEPPTEDKIKIIEVTEEFYTAINLWLLI